MKRVQLMLVSVFKGHLFAVTLHNEGHYCGYVRLENSENKIFDNAKEEYPFVSFIDCHGGITFVDEEDGSWVLPPGKWLGFDTAHNGDGIDVYVVEKIFGKDAAANAIAKHINTGHDTKITPKMVAEECKNIILQILKIKGEKAQEKKYTIELTKDQLYKLSSVIDNEALMADAFFNPETGLFDTYNENGEDVHITPQEYVNTRLETIECK